MGGVSIGGRRAKGTALSPEWFVAQSLILSSGGSLGVVVLLTAAVRGDGGGGMNSFRSPKGCSRLCWERQLGAEVGDSAVLGTEARSQMVELSRLCLEGQLEDEVGDWAVFGAAARSQMVESVVFGVAAQS